MGYVSERGREEYVGLLNNFNEWVGNYYAEIVAECELYEIEKRANEARKAERKRDERKSYHVIPRFANAKKWDT